MNDLKRCPFCGANPRTEVEVTQMGGGEDHIDFSIRCSVCGISKTVRLKIHKYVNFIDIDKAEEQVINEWNKREVIE